MNPEQQKAFNTVVSLRRLTKDTGTLTSRSQSKILQRLIDDDLIVVSIALEQHRKPEGF